MVAAPMDDEAAGLKRGEFVASIRQLAECFHWSRGTVRRFLETLLHNSMMMRVGVDETSVRKGHQYITTFCDLERSRVAYIAQGRGSAGAYRRQ